MRTTMARMTATAGALIGWAALAMQFGLLVDLRGDAASALWRFLGFFTILANLCAAVVLSHGALLPGRRDGLGSVRVEFAVAAAIALVGIVYSLLLRALWDPQGWQLIADRALHDGMPLIYLLYWLLRPHGALGWGDARHALILPLIYCFYALARGAAEGWYPYPFIDATRLGAGELIVNIALLCGGLGLIALALIAVDRALPRAARP